MTVSRVLSGSANVAAGKRAAVMQACRRLGYRPNYSAAVLRGRRSRSLAVVIPASGYAYHARLLIGAQAAAHAAGYHVLILANAAPRKADGGSPELAWPDFECLLARRVDGIIIAANIRRGILQRLAAEHVPLAFIDAPPLTPDALSVCTDDFAGLRAITRYVIARGHRRIVFAGPGDALFTARERRRGFIAAMRDAGLGADKMPPPIPGYGMAAGYQAVMQWQRAKPFKQITAVVCANDYIAIGAMRALRENGRRIPDDVSLTGFAGDEIGAYLLPSLTSMQQPIEAIGRRAAEGIIRRIAQPEDNAVEVKVPAVLVERDSVSSRSR